MATSSEIQVTEAYIGLLGRAPDPAGLAYWTAQLDAAIAAGQSPAVALKRLTNDITLSDEWDNGIGANDASTLAGAEAVVTAMYDNLFDRSLSQAELDYWAPKLVSGEFTAAEMAVALIEGAGTTDADVLSYKQQAATYYVESVGDNFSNESAGEAVADVNGPISLNDSKTSTDYVASGVGVTTDMDDVAAGANVTMTAGDDTVTGTVGTDATYSTQNVLDTSAADNDTFTLTGDAGFTFDDVTKVENVNVNLADTVGAGFTVGAASVTGSTINIDVADTVTVVNVPFAGETTVAVTGLVSHLNTTDVTDLTVTLGGGADVNISADVDAAAIQVNNLEDDTNSITLLNTSADVDLDGTGAANDSASVSGAGTVDLDVSDADLVEEVSLSGNGAAVEFQVSGATGASMTYAVTGDQDVTISGAAGQFDDSAFSDTSTGTTSLDINAGGADANVAEWGVVSGGIELSDDFTGDTVSLASGNTVTISAAQTAGTLTLDSNDTAATSLTINADATTGILDIDDFTSITINTGTTARTIDEIQATTNDSTVTVVGTNDITFNDVVAAGELTVNGDDVTFEEIAVDGDLTVTASGNMVASAAIVADNDVVISGDDIDIQAGLSTAASSATDGNVTLTSTGNDVDTAGTINVDGTLTVTAADQFTTGGALNAENDITITADDYVATSTVDTQEGNLTITATNDVDLNGAVGVDGVLTISQTGTAGSVNTTGGSLDIDNDSTITGDDVTLTAVTVNAGGITVTATGNDVNLDGTVDASGDLIVTATAGSIDATGVLTGADNDVTMTAGDDITVDRIVTAVGNVTLTAANDVTLLNAVGNTDVDGTLSITATAGTALLQDAINAENDATITGDQVDIDDAITVQNGTLTISSTANDVLLDGALTVTEGSAVITASTVLGDVTAGAGAGTITVSNDATVSGDDVTVDDITSTATGNISITSTANDVTVLGSLDATTTQGTLAITSAGDLTLTNGETLDAMNDVTLTATGTLAAGTATIDSTVGDITIAAGTMSGTGTITATAGDITLNMTNDAAAQSSFTTVTATAGSIALSDGDFAITTVNATAADQSLTISGTTDATITTANLDNAALYLTTDNDVAITTLDTPIVAGSGEGDYALGTVGSSTSATVQITTGSGNDSMTLDNDAAGGSDNKFLVSTGDGVDTITVTETGAGSVINAGDGADIFRPVAGGFLGTFEGGDGSDTVSLDNGGDYSSDGIWQNIEVINMEGATATVSAAQLDNDSTFEIQGTSGTISVTTAGVDLSNVTHAAGNQTGFNITGTAAANTLTGSNRDDVINGLGGSDTLTGGLGDDAFTYTATGQGSDTITDFDSGSDTFSLEDTVFVMGTGATAAGLAAVTSTALQNSYVFSGSDLAAFLSGTSGAGWTNTTGKFGLIFVDTDGTDAGVYYVTGTITTKATGTTGAVFASTTTDTIALTGSAAVAASDFVVI